MARSYPMRVMLMIQLVSHVLPSSGEKACSQRAVCGEMPDQTKRTRMGRPSSSWRPFEDAHAVLVERADHRRLEAVDAIAGPVDAPEARARAVETKRHPHEARPVLGDVVVHVAEVAGQKPRFRGRVEGLPFCAAR
jgi:hypothetical protein